MKTTVLVIAAAAAFLVSSGSAAADRYYLGKTAEGKLAGVRVERGKVVQVVVNYRSRCFGRSSRARTDDDSFAVDHHTGSSLLNKDVRIKENGAFRYRRAFEWRTAALRYHVGGVVADGRVSARYVQKSRSRHDGGVERCRVHTRFDIGPSTKERYVRAVEDRIRAAT